MNYKIGEVFKIASGLGGIFNIKIIEINEDKYILKETGCYCPHWLFTYTEEQLNKKIDYCLKGGR